MSFTDRLRDSIRKNDYLWMAVWLLVVINIWFIIFLKQDDFKFIILLGFILLAVLGIWIIKRFSASPGVEEEPASEYDYRIRDFIHDVRPVCEKIFEDEISDLTRPIIEGIRGDFSTSLSWLWEETDDYIAQVEGAITRLKLLTTPLDSLNETKTSLVQQLHTDCELLSNSVRNMHRSKENSFMDLEEFLDSQVFVLKNDMEKEKDVFYDYINRMLSRLSKNKDDIDIDEYFDMDKLSQQFRVILEKALDARQMAFQDSVIRELENFSGDIVGQMQKNANQMFNTFQDIVEVLEHMKQENWDATNLSLRQLNECLYQSDGLREKSSEIMLTLAWQDILIEKRWQEMSERLFVIRERVKANVEEYVAGFISNKLNGDYQGFSAIAGNMENSVLYKALVDAELVYELYKGDKLTNIIEDGIYSLLQFIRPVEAVAGKSIRLTEDGIRTLKSMKNDIRSGEYQALFDKVKSAVNEYCPEAAPYLKDVYPRTFYAFSSYPYIKQKPDNLNQAAWMVFLEITRNHNYDEEVYLLVGLLLAIHQIRNQYIHPLKNLPLELEDMDDLEAVRLAALKAVSLMATHEFRGLSKLNFKGKNGS
ncbi:MAG: hypothetical protein ACM3PE_05625 [Deltaproteobacteria bacterium]